MARALNKLNVKTVEKAKTPGRYSDGGGLYLVVRKSSREGEMGSKAWVLRFTIDGRKRDLGLGAAQDVTLAQARELAVEARALVKNGIDPIEAKDTQPDLIDFANREDLTFGEYALGYVETVTPHFRNPKHRQQWRNTLVTHCEPIWSKRLASIDTDDVLSVLLPIWNKTPETTY